MSAKELLYTALEESCPEMHQSRLNAVLDVAQALQYSQNLSLSEMGRHLSGSNDSKHKIKKVDRLEGNKKLHKEFGEMYAGLSDYVFTYLSQDKTLPIVIDLCFVKDDRIVQMLSAEIATKGRTIPIYRELFKEGEFKERAKSFLENLSKCLPSGREVVIIMDAGFFEDWFTEIELRQWYWICRIRQGRKIRLSDGDWQSIKEFIPQVKEKTTDYKQVYLTQKHERSCRMVTTRNAYKGRTAKTRRGEKNNKISSGRYTSGAKEPWILATNLAHTYTGVSVVKLYAKRMQIEESFRDVKSHQFGLSGRYIRTQCVHRWGVKMLLAAIVQITYWIMGIIGHSQGMQRYFQANTVKDRKVFSYFTLGRFIFEYEKLHQLKWDNPLKLREIIQEELARAW